MGNYYFRLLARLASSELVPVSFRPRLMCAIGFAIASDSLIWPGADLRSRKVTTSPGVFINVGFYHDGCGDLFIGTEVAIGPHVRVITGTHELGSLDRRCGNNVSRPVRIEQGCWIGAGVTILPGVTIEPGCIVAAGAVVTQSTVSHGLYAGVPAKRIRNLQDGNDRLEAVEANR